MIKGSVLRPKNTQPLDDLLTECDEPVRIMSAIIATARKNQEQGRPERKPPRTSHS